jgi:hypothetical protein
MNIDPNLESNFNWDKKVGPDIGGPKPFVPPDDYGMHVIQSSVEREFYISGPPYTDALFVLHRPVRPNTGKLALVFELKVTEETNLYSQALEFDTRLAIAKTGYNFSSQFNQQKGGVFQAYIKGVGWADTPFNPGKFTPGVWTPIRFDYAFDIVNKTYSFVSVAVGPTPFMLPAKFQNLPATPLLWSDSCTLQVQLDLNAKGGAYSHRIREADFLWS